MKNDFPKKLIKIEQYLKGNKDIAFAYLFGSFARDTVTALSDVDIAVYVYSPPIRIGIPRESG